MEEIETESEFYCQGCLNSGRMVRFAFTPDECAFLLAASVNSIKIVRAKGIKTDNEALTAVGKIIVAMGPDRNQHVNYIQKKTGAMILIGCPHKLMESADGA